MTTIDDPDIEGEDCYHGLIDEEELPGILKEYGDYLVRTVCKPKKVAQYCLCINVGKEKPDLKEFPIVLGDAGYFFEGKEEMAYNKVIPLINDLLQRKTHFPDEEIVMIRAVRRPSWEMKHEEVKVNIDDVLGSGKYRKVVSGEIEYYGKKVKVAVKVSQKAEDVLHHEAFINILRELRPMRIIQHPHCSKFFGIVIEKEPVMHIMEMANMGSLYSFLNEKQPMTTIQRANLTIQAAWGLEYLHSKGVTHKNFTTLSCLLNAKGDDTVELKISNYGMNKFGDAFGREESRKPRFPWRYLSPEVIQYETFDVKTDVWMFGMVMMEIYNEGNEPYLGLKRQQICDRIKKGKLQEMPKDFPSHARELISAAWIDYSESRPTMAKVVRALQRYTKSEAPQVAVHKKCEKPTCSREKKSGEGFAKRKRSKRSDKKLN